MKLTEILEAIKKDIKTLEKAVYSDENNSLTNDSFDQNSEDVLTRHLLKLSEIENQFQELTNKFEEVNFKLDKLSNRVSKVQSDNQIRFQQLENKTITKLTTDDENKISEFYHCCKEKCFTWIITTTRSRFNFL